MPKSKEIITSSESEEEVIEKKEKKPKKEQKKASSSSNESESDDDSKSKKRTKKMKDDKTTKKAKKSDETPDSWDIGNNKHVTVSEFKGKWYVGIREMYMDKSGEMKPGKKGISMNFANWNALYKIVDDVNKCVKNKNP